MAPNASNLSDPKYGYDFVVSTTQESINAGMVQYLQNTKGKQPYTYLCFLADKNGDPVIEKSLEEILQMSGQINPFDIPDGTNWDDPRIQKLFSLRFVCAIRLQSGIPPGLITNVPNKGPQLKLPQPIVTLGNSSDNVLFNMYCSDVTVIKNTPGGGWSSQGTWKWFSQKPGTPWFVQTRTSLLVSDLDKDLNTPYFIAHPEEREALKLKLNNMSDSAFSLQQLLFNLDSAIAQTTPKFVGVDDENAAYLLGISFIKLWSSIAKERGLPLIGVSAVAQHPDGSPLRVTGLERWVSPIVDPQSGIPIENASDVQLSATTLNYLCVTDGHKMPGASSFNWNWVEPKDLAESSGTIAIKRSTIAAYLVDQMLPDARKSCIKPKTKVNAENAFGKVNYSWSFTPNQEPTATITTPKDSGPTVAKIDYSSTSKASDSDVATHGELNITSTYSCNIIFGGYDKSVPEKYIGGNTFTIVQNLKIRVYVKWADTSSHANIFDKTITDEYVISVDDNGSLSSSDTGKPTYTDRSNEGDTNSIVNAFTGVGDLIADIKSKSGSFLNAKIAEIPFNQIKNFIFPGAKVFSYKTATFSDYQDLVCLITYVNPTDNQFKLMPNARKLSRVQNPAPVIKLAQVEQQQGKTEPSNPPDSTDPLAKATATSIIPNEAIQQQVHPMSENINQVLEIDDTSDSNNFKSFSINAPKAETPQGGIQISISTDMMLNYVQGELIEPQGKFRALQTANGNALLFAIDSSGVFNVTKETTGETETGWGVADISSNFIKTNFPSSAKARVFDVGQSVMNENTISLGTSVRVNGSDTLILSLLNSPSLTSRWISKPDWKTFPFDAQNPPSSIQITNIYFSETDQKQQYILVDILRDPTSSLKDTARYIIDPFSTSGVYWTPHKLPFDVEEGTYQSCIGRVTNAYIDGIYTAGTVAGAAQLAYVPLFNLSGNAAPMPTRLTLPNKTAPSAIASARNDYKTSDMYGTTDLYAICQSTLYRWDPDQQLDDNTMGKALMTNSILAGTNTIIALIHNQVTTIFGLNSSNVVYYTSCLIEKLADPDSWSVPVPILTDIERITSYINVRDNCNTIYAAGGNTIQQLVQATNTSSKLWQAQPITLNAPSKSKAMSFKSYTSTIQVKGDNGLPVIGGELVLTTNSRTPVYINGLYYILSTTPVTVPVSQTGQVTIIQATKSIVGATITAKMGNTIQKIDPMAKSFGKLAQLSNKSSLKGAQIQTATLAGGVMGTPITARLVSSSVSDSDLQAAADSIGQLTDAYNQQQHNKSVSSSFRMAGRPKPSSLLVSRKSFDITLGNVIAIAPGDLFNWFNTGVDKVIDIIKNAATGLWECVVKIAGQVYHAVLDTVDAVVGAIEWVFDKLKTGIEALILYIEFLFEWDDIRRTKQIMHKLIKFYLQDMVSGIKTVQSQFNDSIAEAQQAVAKLSGIKDWKSLGESASKLPGGNAADPTKGQTSGSQMLANHFRNQADKITMPKGMPEASLVQNLINDLMNAMASQGKVFEQTFEQLKVLAKEFLNLSLADILKRLVGILVESILGTTQVVVDALLNVLYELASTAIAVLDTKIHIPIISDILNAIGVSDISFLDLFTWIGAAGITIIYKVGYGKAPFPDDAASRALLQARDWNSLSAILKQPSSAFSNKSNGLQAGFDLNISQAAGATIYTAGHAITGFIVFTGNFLFYAEAMDISPINVFGTPAAVMGVIGAVAAGGADALVGKLPLENTAVADLRKVTTVATVVSKLVFSGPGQKYLATGKLSFLKADDNRKVGAVFNSLLVFPALICTCYHFSELSEKPESKERSCAIIGETSSMVQYLGRISYCIALFDSDPETRVVPASQYYGGKQCCYVRIRDCCRRHNLD